jgi:hypothetical protein
MADEMFITGLKDQDLSLYLLDMEDSPREIDQKRFKIAQKEQYKRHIRNKEQSWKH